MVSDYIEAQLRRISLVRAGRTVLKDIDWSIRPGQRWLLAGANGAGKTQLLKLVAGAVWPAPTGRELRRYRRRGRWHRTPREVQADIGYVGAERQDRYERYGWNHSVEQIVGTGLYRTDIPLDALSARDRRTIRALLARLNIAALGERRFLTLSYGERRLVLLARALAGRPRLLLLDELANGLDDEHRAAVQRWLGSLGRSHLPWVLATHRLEDLPQGLTHALLLERGRIVYRGSIARAPLARWLADRDTRSESGLTGARRGAARGRARVLVRLTRASVYLSERRVLERISLSVRAGECWVVHGRNGSGKSTLLRTIYGDHGVAASGSIERAGIMPGVPLEDFKRSVGIVAPHLQAEHPRELTVLEVVESGRHASIGLAQRSRAADRAAAAGALEFFGLARLARRTLAELSYGQLRRVLFARAWVNRPALLLLDEPFAGVDAPTRSSLMQQLELLAARGVSLVIATHHAGEWPRCVTHELELAAGVCRYCGPVRRRTVTSAATRAPRARHARVSA